MNLEKTINSEHYENQGFKKIELEPLVGTEIDLTLIRHGEEFSSKGIIFKNAENQFTKYELISYSEKSNDIIKAHLLSNFLLEKEGIQYAISPITSLNYKNNNWEICGKSDYEKRNKLLEDYYSKNNKKEAKVINIKTYEKIWRKKLVQGILKNTKSW